MVIALATGTIGWSSGVCAAWVILHHAVMGGVGLGLVVLYTAYGLTGLLLLCARSGCSTTRSAGCLGHTAAYVDELSTRTGGSRRRSSDLRRTNETMLTALCGALELRDQETEGHSQRVVRYAREIAAALALGPAVVEVVVHGALLHDIGKIGVPDAILLKPGKLNDDEWAVMRQHPEIGYRMIAHIPFLAPAAVLVRHHHERWDGRGYPAGLPARRSRSGRASSRWSTRSTR